MVSVRLLVFSLATLGALPILAHAQNGGAVPSPAVPSYPSTPGFPSDRDNPFGSDDHLDPALVHRREEARKTERKKRMVDTANRLLVLTQQLQADLQGRQATPEDQKRLDEIARLARQVKDQMRN